MPADGVKTMAYGDLDVFQPIQKSGIMMNHGCTMANQWANHASTMYLKRTNGNRPSHHAEAEIIFS